MTQPGVGPEDRSLVGYINGLPSLTDAIEAVRTYAGRWASEGTDNQPVDAAVTEGLTTIATLLGHAQSIAQELPGQARVGNEADIHRAENPRKGSGSVEARADYTAAQRDM